MCKGVAVLPPKVLYQVNDLILSPGGSFLYKVESAPFCRLYHNPNTGKIEPNTYESSWYYNGTKWVQDEPNYVSYMVTMPEYDVQEPFEITVSKYYKLYEPNRKKLN